MENFIDLNRVKFMLWSVYFTQGHLVFFSQVKGSSKV